MFWFLFILWMIFNGRFALDVIVIGVIVCYLIDLFAMHFCKWNITKDWRWAKFLPKLFAYFGLLVVEIIKANLAVMRIILSPNIKENIHPQVIRFNVDYKSSIIRAMLANSITLTPGTITIRLRNDHFVVHALTPEMGTDMDKSSFYTSCAELDKETCQLSYDEDEGDK